MKKLMIAAATAAMVGGAFAALPEAGQVTIDEKVGSMYNVAITLKTLAPTVSGGGSKGCAICPTDADSCKFFEQGTLKINGVIASCDCDGDGDGAFAHGYYWVGSGKKAVPVLDKLPAEAAEFTDLPSGEDAIQFAAVRFGKTNKKAVAEISIAKDEFATLDGVGFGSYTDAKYKFDKEADQYILKTAAKVSASGSIMGTIKTDWLAENDGNAKTVAGEDYVAFPVGDVCTVAVDCNDGTAQAEVPAVGTFSVKPRSVVALKKVIPAVCFAE